MQTEVTMPNFDVNETSASIADIKVENKQFVKEGQILLTTENTKTVHEIISPADGYILLLCHKMQTKSVGTRLAVIFESLKELEEFDTNCQSAQDSDAMESADINATKKALDLANKLNIDLAVLAKLKKDDVIKVKDVQEYFDNTNKENIKTTPVFKYDRERVIIIGAGNGAEVVIDILLDDFNKQIIGLVDDNVTEMANYDYPVLKCNVPDFPEKVDRNAYDTVIISIGSTLKSMQLRKKVFEQYSDAGIIFTNAIAKSAEIRRGAKIGTGNIIGAGSYIGTLTHVGNNNSISYGVYIGHHNVIGDHNLLAPGLFTSGSVKIGNECIIPAGVVVRNLVDIGNRVAVPVGYAIANSISDDTIIKQQT